jgi:predicted enzyme related to lactoylglutathione lyase
MPVKTPVPLDYIEFSSEKLEETQTFFAHAFGWEFVDYGEDYRDIRNAGLGGGISRVPLAPPLPVLKTDDLEAMLERVRAAGGHITREIFAFPGGRRFHFVEPGGTEMAVWSET